MLGAFNMIKITISVEIRPTEDEKKILEALNKLFRVDPNKLTKKKLGLYELLIYESDTLETLEPFVLRVKQRNISTHIRAYLEKNIIGNKTHIFINKQVAVVGKVSLCDSPSECPLGAITIEIEADNLNELLEVVNKLTSN